MAAPTLTTGGGTGKAAGAGARMAGPRRGAAPGSRR